MIGRPGGAGNFRGFTLPMIGKVLRKEVDNKIRFIATRSGAAPNLVKRIHSRREWKNTFSA